MIDYVPCVSQTEKVGFETVNWTWFTLRDKARTNCPFDRATGCELIIEEMCLPESCYVFTIKDDGDGDFDGSYTLEVDGEVLVSDDSGFTSAAYTLFGSC